MTNVENKPIGRIIATEKKPTTVDNFAFWTDSKLVLNPFDVIKVEHVGKEGVGKSYTYGVIEDISHITDASSFLTSFISSDFGDVTKFPTLRVGMNYVDAKVICNDRNIYIPLQSDAKVYLASKQEVNYALGLSNKHCQLPCGYLEMYENFGETQKVVLPVKLVFTLNIKKHEGATVVLVVGVNITVLCIAFNKNIAYDVFAASPDIPDMFKCAPLGPITNRGSI